MAGGTVDSEFWSRDARPNVCKIAFLTRQVPSCPYGLCDVVSQRPKGAYSARLVGQNVYREIERDCGNRIQYREKVDA